MKPLTPNSMIQGRYLIVQPIGKGGMGEVYLAVDQRLGSAVALKRTFFSEDNTLGTAFEREARILARLRHPVLPKVIDHFSENGDQFLVMEHISGDDISKRLETANKPFPVSWVMFWADEMLDALSYLHSHEPPIVQRDIKPQNLKLTDDNHIVLLDFGLSKDFDTTTSGVNSASVAGYSPYFASMEQIRGTGTDARSDLYSLAATLYQMLTNTVPPDALTRADAMLGGKPDPIKPLNEVNSEITPAISDVILKAVSIRQEARYDSALEMQKALRRAYNKEKVDEAAPAAAVPVEPVVPAPPVSASLPKPPAAEAAIPVEVIAETETKLRTEPPAAFEETVKMESLPVPVEAKQSELKTEVLSADNLAEPETNSGSEAREPAPVAVAASAAVASAPVVSPPHARPAVMPGAPPKKGSSKAGLVVGILVGLVLFGAVGGAAGWYLLTREVPSAAVSPSPTPAVETPTEDTPTLTEADSQVPPVSANSEVGEVESSVDANSNSAGAGSANTAVPKQPANITTRSTQPKTTAPAPRSTPKPKTGEKKVILQ